jgi:hypothetical protein
MEILGIILALFTGAFLVETSRVPRVKKWSHRNGFIILDNISEKIVLELKQLAKKFGHYSVPGFGFSMSGTSLDIAITITEHSLYLDNEQSNWFTLIALVRPDANLAEFRMESRDEIVRDFSRTIELLLYPLKYLARQRDWKWIQQKLTPVDFSEDINFDNAFKVYGDISEAKRALGPATRAALVRHRWIGQLVVSGDTIVWRRKGFLWPSRLDRVLTEVKMFRTIFLQS